MASETGDSLLTEQQLEVLELQENGYTQQDIAEVLNLSKSEVSAIERTARANVATARQTLEQIQNIRSPPKFTVQAGTSFESLADELYARGDEAGVKVDYCRPGLITRLAEILGEYATNEQLTTSITVRITENGDVRVATETAEDSL